MRTAFALVMLLVSGAAGWLAFGLHRLVSTPPPGVTAPPAMSEHLVSVGGHLFTPWQVLSTLLAVALVAAVAAIVALASGRDKSPKSVD